MSPALAGGFFTTEPPGETLTLYIYGPITLWQIDGEAVETVADFIFWAPKSLQMVISAMYLKDAYSLVESYDQPRQHIKK